MLGLCLVGYLPYEAAYGQAVKSTFIGVLFAFDPKLQVGQLHNYLLARDFAVIDDVSAELFQTIARLEQDADSFGNSVGSSHAIGTPLGIKHQQERFLGWILQ